MTLTPITVSIAVAGLVFLAVFLVAGIVLKSRAIARKMKRATEYEERQINAIRKKSFAFRNFEPLVRAFENDDEDYEQNKAYDHYLDIKGEAPPWKASTYIATKKVEAIIRGVVATLAWYFKFAEASIFFGVCLALLFYAVIVAATKSEALTIKRRIVQRLPFVIDLMALVRLANGSFGESLEILAKENDDHPIGEVFERARSDSERGRTQREVLGEMARRMNDPAFDEMATAIINADELGRPVAQTLSELAAQMRLRRQQHGEALSGKAQVTIMYPALLIMVACLLIIVAPFVLQYMQNDGGGILGN